MTPNYSFRISVLALFILIPTGGICQKAYDDILLECADVTSTTHLCLTALTESLIITLYRENITRLGPTGTGMIAKITPMATGGLAEVKLVGWSSTIFHYVSFAIADRAKGSMGAGIPALICMIHRDDYKAKMLFLGTLSGAFAVTSIGARKQEDYFQDGDVEEEQGPAGATRSKVIVCKFKITSKMLKLDSTELDLEKNPYNVAFAAGRVFELDHQAGDIDTLRPSTHTPTDRFVSTSKYFLHRSFSAQAHIAEYLKCGITDYCVAGGLNGCAASGFDCKFFVKFVRKSDTTISVILRSTTFNSFIGIGFSSSPNIAKSQILPRWNNLKLITVCEVGSPGPWVLRVECHQKDEKDTTPCISSTQTTPLPAILQPGPIVLSEMINSYDEKVDVLSCSFDLEFSGEDLEMMKRQGTLLQIGGRTGSGWSQLLKFPIDRKSVYFSTIHNLALLKENETTLPPDGVWEVVELGQGNLGDPSDLKFNLVGRSNQLVGTLVITGLCVIFSVINYHVN